MLNKIDKKINAKRKRRSLMGPIEVYCPYCKKDVQLVRSKFSWGWMIFWTLITFFAGFWIYPLYHLFKSKTRCHICQAKVGDIFQRGLYEKEKN